VFAVIAVALAIDVSRVLVSLRGAAKYKSAALRSNAFHFAGDMTGSLAVPAGLVAVSAGFTRATWSPRCSSRPSSSRPLLG
jgi:divalent metal cation (Fe/Co/Zn/Cd) transporter